MEEGVFKLPLTSTSKRCRTIEYIGTSSQVEGGENGGSSLEPMFHSTFDANVPTNVVKLEDHERIGKEIKIRNWTRKSY